MEAITKTQKSVFLNYVMDFYGPDSDLYPIKGLSFEIANMALNRHLHNCANESEEYAHFQWRNGDSFDREQVRYIIDEMLSGDLEVLL